MADFEAFKRLTLLYFAAASYSESVRRLGHPERAARFLLHARPPLRPGPARCVALALTMPDASGDPRAARTRLFAEIDRAIEPFDTAGLRDRGRRDWYPVLAADLVAGRRSSARRPGRSACCSPAVASRARRRTAHIAFFAGICRSVRLTHMWPAM